MAHQRDQTAPILRCGWRSISSDFPYDICIPELSEEKETSGCNHTYIEYLSVYFAKDHFLICRDLKTFPHRVHQKNDKRNAPSRFTSQLSSCSGKLERFLCNRQSKVNVSSSSKRIDSTSVFLKFSVRRLTNPCKDLIETCFRHQ